MTERFATEAQEERDFLAGMLEEIARELRAGSWDSFNWNEEYQRPELRESVCRRIRFDMKLERR